MDMLRFSYLAALDFYGDSVHSCYTIHSPRKWKWRSFGGTRIY